MKTLPVLYKKTSTGSIQSWTIATEENVIVTVYGKKDGKMQTTKDVIADGKNTGKSNATTAIEQAEAEAQAKWEKQINKGYVESLDKAEKGIKDIDGGFDCMLAHKFSDQGHKIVYPAFVQPKLDGTRCCAIISDGVATLWSRGRKPVTSMPHIVEELEETFPTGSHMIDGELYNHKGDFENIVHLVRQEDPDSDHKEIEYFIYDQNIEGGFETRHSNLVEKIGDNKKYLKLLKTVKINNEDELMEQFDLFLAERFEGGIVRNANGKYVGKRSYDLQKIKEFDDAEFKIVGYEEGRGHLAGHLAAFVCEMDNGETFKVKMKGETAKLKEYFEDHSLWEGRMITVKFQGLTGKNGVPRFPVGLRLRDEE